MNDAAYNERLLRLEGAIVALQAVNGILLNYVTQADTATRTDALRRDIRRTLGRVAEYVTLDVLSDYTPAARNQFQEGFVRCLNDVMNKLVLFNSGQDTGTHDDAPL